MGTTGILRISIKSRTYNFKVASTMNPELVAPVTAADRTPVEIWRQILHLAVRWSLFPSEYDPDIKKIAFFRRGCTLYHQYIEMIFTRSRLCRVCRSWAAIMDEIVDSLVIMGVGPDEGRSWPSSDLIPLASCIIQAHSNGFCSHMKNTDEQNSALLIPPTQFILHPLQKIAQTQLARESIAAEALFLGTFADYTVHLVRLTTRLKVLEFNYRLGGSPIAIQDIAMHRGLTHLRITMLRAHDVGSGIDLPDLKHLEIGLFERPGEPRSKHFLSHWKIPMLEILVITGFAHQTTGDDINRFLSASPPKLHIIVLTFGEYEFGELPRKWMPPLNILTLLPNLSLLGVTSDWFGREEAIHLYSEMKKFRKRLPNILIFDQYTVFRPFSVAPDIVRWWRFQSGDVDYITIDTSWRELASTAETFSPASLYSDGSSARLAIKSFFEELLKEDVRFCDSNGDMLGDSESQEFILGVEKAGFQVPSSSRR